VKFNLPCVRFYRLSRKPATLLDLLNAERRILDAIEGKLSQEDAAAIAEVSKSIEDLAAKVSGMARIVGPTSSMNDVVNVGPVDEKSFSK